MMSQVEKPRKEQPKQWAAEKFNQFSKYLRHIYIDIQERGFKKWFAEKLNQFFQYSRHIQVLWASLCSFVFLIISIIVILTISSDSKANFSALAVLFVSSPVAFVVWRFRDENQSKDINLKEFQKISEWVTGAHFPDAEKIKVTGKQKHDKSATPIQWQNDELGIEFNMPAKSKQALHTFSKQDGAVGLQIAAVYNLLPFYRGDYGQAFEKPSVHLLHSAWKVLQHDILQKLDNADDDKMREKLIEQLHQRADSPLGQAITRVLLACDSANPKKPKPLLHRHPEIFPGICLSGMDFELAGLKHEILRKTLFCGQPDLRRDLTGAQWQGVRGKWNIWNLSHTTFSQANLSGIKLIGANLFNARLDKVKLLDAELVGADLQKTVLIEANLSGASLGRAQLQNANLTNANLSGAQLNHTDLSNANLDEANLSKTNLTGAKLVDTRLVRANLSNALLMLANLSNAQLNGANLSSIQLSGANLSNSNLGGATLLNTTVTIEQLQSAQCLVGCLTDSNNFARYKIPEQQELRDKGLIVFYHGNTTINHLYCQHKTQAGWANGYTADLIPFNIDLTATQAANPDWKISIE